jgi:sterol desaturase/sphingolipid hydroxylase (fatty acid hydroxylase superfamily)
MSGRRGSFLLHKVLQNTFLLVGLGAVTGVVVVLTFGLTAPVLRGFAVAAIAAPVVEYCIHRFISHGSLMYKIKPTAAIWKRIHYDHHQNPANPAVLLAAPQQVIGGSILFAVPIGWIAGGYQGAAAAVAVGLFHAGVVELVHANAHVPVLPDWRYFKYLKSLHLLHHFRNETVNFGVTSPAFDRLFRTYHGTDRPLRRSASVRNLGYGAEEAQHYPWLSELNKKQSPFGDIPGFMAREAQEHEGGES